MEIILSERVTLRTITIDSYTTLRELMVRIYPPAYQYLWHDDGKWYLDYLYSKNEVTKAITEPDSRFYYVVVDGKEEGILKINLVEPFPEQPTKKATRLHRIYLSETTQSQGISSLIMAHVRGIARKQKSEIIWLDCMDSKHQALNYYKKHGFVTSQLNHLSYKGLIDKYRGIYYMWSKV